MARLTRMVECHRLPRLQASSLSTSSLTTLSPHHQSSTSSLSSPSSPHASYLSSPSTSSIPSPSTSFLSNSPKGSDHYSEEREREEVIYSTLPPSLHLAYSLEQLTVSASLSI